MPLTPDQIKAIASRAAGSILANKLKATDPTRTPREKELWAQGEEILRQLDNGLSYRGPWLPYGPDGEFIGHIFNDDTVTETSFVCHDIEECKADLVRARKEFNSEPPVFKAQEVGKVLPAESAKDLDEAIRQFEEQQKQWKEAHKYGVDIAEASEQEYVEAGLAYSKKEAKETGFSLNTKLQEELLREEYRKKRALHQQLEVASKARAEESNPTAFTIQENVNPCPNLQPMAEWIKGETPGTCRPCTLTPVVQWYWEELKERGLTDIAAELEAEVGVLEEDNVEQVMAICKDLDEIKANAPEELRKRLEEFDCAIQSFDPAEISDEEKTLG